MLVAPDMGGREWRWSETKEMQDKKEMATLV